VFYSSDKSVADRSLRNDFPSRSPLSHSMCKEEYTEKSVLNRIALMLLKVG